MSDPVKIVQQHLERLLRREVEPEDIVPRLEEMSPAELTSILPTLYSTGAIGAHREALRDTINAVLYRKVSESLVGSIAALDRSTERLTKVGWWITVVVGVVGVVVSVVVALR